MFENNQYIPYDVEPMDQPGPEAPRPPKKKGHMALKVVSLALVCAIAGGVGGGALTAHLIRGREEPAARDEAVPASGEAGPESVEKAESGKEETPNRRVEINEVVHTNVGDKNLTAKEVYDQNVNAVVGINVTGTTAGTNIWGYATPFAASGSGFIISEDGYVVTNNHVVADAETVKVSMYDGTTYDAEIIGAYEANDVALLKVDAAGLPCVSIGDSDDLAVGDEVAAIGNPLGQLTFTMTVGYVSALDRAINSDGNPINMLQTDAAINSGNSGGPLFDMNGNVVGITTAKYSGSSSSGASIEGIGFAIPINDAMSIVNDLREHGYVTGQPYLGVSLREVNLDETTASYYNLPLGVYVDTVTEGSCAEKAGVQKGDIITALGDTKVECYTDLAAALKTHRAGDETALTVYRSGESKTLKITLDERPPEPEQPEEPQVQQIPQQQSPSGGDAYRFNPFDFFGGF